MSGSCGLLDRARYCGGKLLERRVSVPAYGIPMLGGNSVTLQPRPDRMNGNPALVGHCPDPSISNDLRMVSHSPMMHYAPLERKCHLHHHSPYLSLMDQIEVGKRLAAARSAAGYDSASDAAEAMGIPVSTYIQHENGTRGFRTPTAERYAKRFKTTPEWLLYARGTATAPGPNEVQLTEMMQAAITEKVTVNTTLADLPRIVAPSLYEQLARFMASDRTASHIVGGLTGREKSGKPAKQRGQDKSNNA